MKEWSKTKLLNRAGEHSALHEIGCFQIVPCDGALDCTKQFVGNGGHGFAKRLKVCVQWHFGSGLLVDIYKFLLEVVANTRQVVWPGSIADDSFRKLYSSLQLLFEKVNLVDDKNESIRSRSLNDIPPRIDCFFQAISCGVFWVLLVKRGGRYNKNKHVHFSD